ncbi:segregation and condensation protein A [Beggiatoa leptomitoformis]|uniref:Segregation and condensation protein A n=1 Tax=Beggiatoa leptomitoformis TaxID=288004 RepID=A0A2N9YGZ5_9GAMM|nr:ScpA family protein [Beggiatoa leptomitoformis]ALG67946.1 segregation/condensation protein A [Beggiatoa leptomitoformis]AUI69780.1 segregation/condensation protein A [Beggiatoa leptomitoformis]
MNIVTDTPESSPLDNPLAIIEGAPFIDLPDDLYIPPDALKVFLEQFEGPLDLLLYLIQHQNINILDIPIAEVTRQYLQFIDLMKDFQLDLAAEYLVMAAVLMEIKSRLLLPEHQARAEDDPANDPRAKLVQQLQEYARFKKAAETFAVMPQVGRELFPVSVDTPEIPYEVIIPTIPWSALLLAMKELMARAALFRSHQIMLEPLSVRERMGMILACLEQGRAVAFIHLFTVEEGRAGVVVTLLAILELAKESLITITQAEIFSPIQVEKNTEHLHIKLTALSDY